MWLFQTNVMLNLSRYETRKGSRCSVHFHSEERGSSDSSQELMQRTELPYKNGKYDLKKYQVGISFMSKDDWKGQVCILALKFRARVPKVLQPKDPLKTPYNILYRILVHIKLGLWQCVGRPTVPCIDLITFRSGFR